MNDNDLKILKKRGKCTIEEECFFKRDGDCYKKSYCKDRMAYARTRQTGGA